MQTDFLTTLTVTAHYFPVGLHKQRVHSLIHNPDSESQTEEKKNN